MNVSMCVCPCMYVLTCIRTYVYKRQQAYWESQIHALCVLPAEPVTRHTLSDILHPTLLPGAPWDQYGRRFGRDRLFAQANRK